METTKPSHVQITANSCLRALGLTALLLLVLLASCSNSPTLERLNTGDTILAFGDSLTFGKGTSRELAYPAILQELSGRSVINAGVSGETTAQGVNRLPGLLQEHDPALVILFEGGNDVLQNLAKSDTKANLARMIEAIKAHGAQLILVAVPEKSLFSSAAPWYGELADEHNVLVQDSIVAKLIKKPKMKSDSVHFNTAGYRALAEAIFELLSENGAF